MEFGISIASDYPFVNTIDVKYYENRAHIHLNMAESEHQMNGSTAGFRIASWLDLEIPTELIAAHRACLET